MLFENLSSHWPNFTGIISWPDRRKKKYLLRYAASNRVVGHKVKTKKRIDKDKLRKMLAKLIKP